MRDDLAYLSRRYLDGAMTADLRISKHTRQHHMLDYVDSPLLRRNVHKALNRGEAYHRLRLAIAYAHGGRLRARSQHEQELWNEYARLIANAVVHYNSVILSEVLHTLEKRRDKAAVESRKRISPLAWQHVNFYGRYRFDNDLLPIDLAALATQLTETDANLWQQSA